MPLLAEDPSLNFAILPDFESEEFEEAHAQLINDTIDDRLAAELLANLWRVQNDADKQAEHRQADEAEAQKERTCLDEQEAAVMEEHKKNKSKYAPIRDINVLSDPIIIPCQYTVCKMKSSKYCELFYFTNSGLEEASHMAFTADKDALVMLPMADGLHKWIPAGAARDPKVQIVKDKNLTWEQFNEAAHI
ncbi:uncharacterized protein EDB93DRAFT_1311330 [Suillus bovinus]|uniref:uncharacterized protein n=1 Tax=Suillus bovinus TaxID=48563 RepID=UPI001B86D3E7|nr:uncharacterized protein EDB93DRAFT_1311330 [Suillus bovinus]KAG2131723.1 hypothetical protein EDB93DRAFT_1311330 [Suillus bovinus]